MNYSPTYKDHRFWVLPISDVMAAGGIPNSVKSVEDIEVGYYSNSKIDLVDKDTGTKKSTFSGNVSGSENRGCPSIKNG